MQSRQTEPCSAPMSGWFRWSLCSYEFLQAMLKLHPNFSTFMAPRRFWQKWVNPHEFDECLLSWAVSYSRPHIAASFSHMHSLAGGNSEHFWMCNTECRNRGLAWEASWVPGTATENKRLRSCYSPLLPVQVCSPLLQPWAFLVVQY